MSRDLVRLPTPKSIVCDLDGTIGNVSFFGGTIIPFVRENVKRYLEDTIRDDSTQDVIEIMGRENRDFPRRESDKVIATAAEDYILEQINQKDLKNSGQIMNLLVMMDGFERKRIEGHVYEDVSAAFYFWRQSLKIDISVLLSSHPELAKLQLVFSQDGNLDTFITEYFSSDSVGSKKETSTFENLERKLGVRAKDALFLTDDPREAVAAREAGWLAVRVGREDKRFSREERREVDGVISSFDQLLFN